MLASLYLHLKSRRVCIKTRSTPASLPHNGQITEHTTVKWTFACNEPTWFHLKAKIQHLDTEVTL